MADIINPGLLLIIIRSLLAILILLTYFKYNVKVAPYLSAFVAMVVFVTIGRIITETTGNIHVYFLMYLSAMIGTIIILHVLEKFGNIRWLKTYKIVPVFSLVFVIISFFNAYILGGLANETPLTLLPTTLINAGGQALAAYYFYRFGKNLPSFGKYILVLGLLLDGILYPIAAFLVTMGLTSLVFFLALVFTLMIGIGYFLCFRTANKMSHNKD